MLYAASKGREEIVRFLMGQVNLASHWLSNDLLELSLARGRT